MSLVSVIIPTVNRPNLVKRAIESVLKQSYEGEIELYIIDSSDNDKTEKLCNLFKNLKKRKIFYIKNENSQLPIDNYIIGSRYICGEYSKFLNDDDWLEPSYISYAVETMISKNVACVVSNVNLIKNFSKEKSTIRDYYNVENGLVQIEQVLDFILKSSALPVTDSAGLMKSEKLKEAFFSSLEHFECTKLQFGFDFYINYYPVFDGSGTYLVEESLVNCWAGNDSMTLNVKKSKISYCYFFAFLKMINLFDINVKTHRELIEHRASMIKVKSFFNKDIKKLIPEIDIRFRIILGIFVRDLVKKTIIKVKYSIKD
jgi:glycosyltransferase involved in cell wall biosynthesis